MIVGVGIDIVEIDRIRDGLRRFGNRFVERIAHPVELDKAPKAPTARPQYWASRFAAKEAFSKAFGTGIGAQVPWHGVGVAKAKNGQPSLEFSRELKANLKKRGVTRWHVSLSHTGQTAVAMVVLEGTGKGRD